MRIDINQYAYRYIPIAADNICTAEPAIPIYLLPSGFDGFFEIKFLSNAPCLFSGLYLETATKPIIPITTGTKQAIPKPTRTSVDTFFIISFTTNAAGTIPITCGKYVVHSVLNFSPPLTSVKDLEIYSTRSFSTFTSALEPKIFVLKVYSVFLSLHKSAKVFASAFRSSSVTVPDAINSGSLLFFFKNVALTSADIPFFI